MAIEIKLCKDPMSGEELTEMEKKGFEFICMKEIPNYPHGNYWHYFRTKEKRENKKTGTNNTPKK